MATCFGPPETRTSPVRKPGVGFQEHDGTRFHAGSCAAYPLRMSQRLVAIADLPDTGVTSVTTSAGRLAVGIAGGEPFAVSPVCRHLRGDLAKGRVAEDDCLECPLHAARFDVRSGEMTRGPQGAFKPVAGVVKGTLGRMRLKTHPVVDREGVLYLEG